MKLYFEFNELPANDRIIFSKAYEGLRMPKFYGITPRQYTEMLSMAYILLSKRQSNNMWYDKIIEDTYELIRQIKGHLKNIKKAFDANRYYLTEDEAVAAYEEWKLSLQFLEPPPIKKDTFMVLVDKTRRGY